jgi:hypothetical protein
MSRLAQSLCHDPYCLPTMEVVFFKPNPARCEGSVLSCEAEGRVEDSRVG